MWIATRGVLDPQVKFVTVALFHGPSTRMRAGEDIYDGDFVTIDKFGLAQRAVVNPDYNDHIVGVAIPCG